MLISERQYLYIHVYYFHFADVLTAFTSSRVSLGKTDYDALVEIRELL